MKKLFFAITCCLLMAGSFAQSLPNISTGSTSWSVSPGGPALAIATPHPIWNSSVSTPVPGTGAKWVSPTGSYNVTAGTYVYEKIIPVSGGISALNLNFQVAADDEILSMELVKPGGGSYFLSVPPVFSTTKPYALRKANDTTFKCPEKGEWKLRIKVRFLDAIGGLILSGNANLKPGTCCQCDLPKVPPIKSANGPLCACDPIKFSTINCPGATYVWTVKDDKGNNISFTGNGTSSIVLNYSLAQQIASLATGLVVTVQITCGDYTVTNTIKPDLKPIPKTNVSFSLTDDGAGHYTATATSLATANGNGWTLKEVNCPGPNPCSWVAGGIKWQATGATINIPNGVLVKGKCYVLTHYVNVCSANWVAGPCTVYKATCFKLDGNNAMMRMKSSDTDKNDAQLILKDMIEEINGLEKGSRVILKERDPEAKQD